LIIATPFHRKTPAKKGGKKGGKSLKKKKGRGRMERPESDWSSPAFLFLRARGRGKRKTKGGGEKNNYPPGRTRECRSAHTKLNLKKSQTEKEKCACATISKRNDLTLLEGKGKKRGARGEKGREGREGIIQSSFFLCLCRRGGRFCGEK